MAAGILGWIALTLQYALVLTGTMGADSFNRRIYSFSYFTVLTNILATLALTLPCAANSTWKFFQQALGVHRDCRLHEGLAWLARLVLGFILVSGGRFLNKSFKP